MKEKNLELFRTYKYARQIGNEILTFMLNKLHLKNQLFRTPALTKSRWKGINDYMGEKRDGLFYANRLTYDNIELLRDLYNDQILAEINAFDDVKSILDVGCGNIIQLLHLANHLKDKELFGVDISSTRLKIGKHYVKNENIMVLTASANYLGMFKNDSIDLIYTCHSLEQMPTIINNVIKEFYRICQKSIILIEPFFCLQNVVGKLHNANMHYVRNIPFFVTKNGFKIRRFVKLPLGVPWNRPGVLVATK